MSFARVFGPVPSRRLGRSLGINNIPPKTCTYSCVYCQLGRAVRVTSEREHLFDPEDLYAEVSGKLDLLRDQGTPIDYLTIVPDGEPTVDLNLGRLIELLKTTGIRVAVISNSSLTSHDDVRGNLAGADCVSLKVDSVAEDAWRRINRPHGRIHLDSVLSGIRSFAEEYDGTLVTESMLVRGLNDSHRSVTMVADFLADLKPHASYLSVPIRPPAEKWVRIPDESVLAMAYDVFREKGIRAELLIGYEGNEFASTGNLEDDLLGITAVHPMREDAVHEYLRRTGNDYCSVEKLISDGRLIVTEYKSRKFYVRKLESSDS